MRKFDHRLADRSLYVLGEILRLDRSPIASFYWGHAHMALLKGDYYQGWAAIGTACQWLAQLEEAGTS